MGGPEFFGVVQGGTIFFNGPKGEGLEFFEHQRGGEQNFFSKKFFEPSAQFILNYNMQGGPLKN